MAQFKNFLKQLDIMDKKESSISEGKAKAIPVIGGKKSALPSDKAIKPPRPIKIRQGSLNPRGVPTNKTHHKSNKMREEVVDEAFINITHNHYTSPQRRRKSTTLNPNEKPKKKGIVAKALNVLQKGKTKALNTFGKKGHASASSKGFIYPSLSKQGGK